MNMAYRLAATKIGLDVPTSASPYTPDTDRMVSEAMQRGIDLEPFARNQYTLRTGHNVQEVGYVELSGLEFVGFSPDGLIGDDGLVEIKCPMGPEFVRLRQTLEIKQEYIHQMQFGMWITGRAWCDHFTFHPDMGVASRIRVERDETMMQRLGEAIPAFNDLVIACISSAVAGED